MHSSLSTLMPLLSSDLYFASSVPGSKCPGKTCTQEESMQWQLLLDSPLIPPQGSSLCLIVSSFDKFTLTFIWTSVLNFCCTSQGLGGCLTHKTPCTLEEGQPLAQKWLSNSLRPSWSHRCTQTVPSVCSGSYSLFLSRHWSWDHDLSSFFYIHCLQLPLPDFPIPDSGFLSWIHHPSLSRFVISF